MRPAGGGRSSRPTPFASCARRLSARRHAELSRVLAAGRRRAGSTSSSRMPATAYTDYPWVPADAAGHAAWTTAPRPVRPDSYCARDNYTLFPAAAGVLPAGRSPSPTSCAARVAFALSQIFVTSGVDNGRNYAMRHYQQLFRDRAFGNFHDLMVAVTLSPVMGDYLDMVNNNKANPATGTNPNENYAREILQLFSIGLYQLNPDGSLQRSTPPASPSRPTTSTRSRASRGPSRAGPIRRSRGRSRGATIRATTSATCVPVPANHETRRRSSCSAESVAPANLTPEQDLAFAHRQHLRRTRTSAPSSPGNSSRSWSRATRRRPTWGAWRPSSPTTARASAATCARWCAPSSRTPRRAAPRKIDPGYGKLAEPVLWMASIARAFGGRTDGVFFRASVGGTRPVRLLSARPSSTTTRRTTWCPARRSHGPEFGILNTGTAIARANFATALVFTPADRARRHRLRRHRNGARFLAASRRRPPTPARLPIASTASCSPAGCRAAMQARPSSPRSTPSPRAILLGRARDGRVARRDLAAIPGGALKP